MQDFTLHLNMVNYDVESFKKDFSYSDESYYNSRSRDISLWHQVYQITLKQTQLGLEKTIKDKSLPVLISKAQSTIDKWAIIWNKKHTGETILQSIKDKVLQLDNILLQTLKVDDTVNFDRLKNTINFEETEMFKSLQEKLANISKPSEPTKTPYPDKPEFISPKIGLLDKISGKSKSILLAAQSDFDYKLTEWEKQVESIRESNEHIQSVFEAKIKEWEENIRKLELEIEEKKRAFDQSVEKANQEIDDLKKAYLNNDSYAIEKYCEIVLSSSEYPEYFPKEFEIEFNDTNQLLVINYTLPEPDSLPKEKDVKFNASQNTTTSIYFSEKEKIELFNKVVHMTILRTLHEIFEADSINAIDFICLNAFVNHLNKANGNHEYKCIATISVSKIDFQKINLANVNPELCFRELKGIAAKTLANLTPVAPIIVLDKTDSRFIDGVNVLKELHESLNLASMDWESFEHLIRELFNKEFSQHGGEVKVTQSSRDGGVDAVAFDPDPIKGGKIVIQAKRYSNVVGVSAVRDLFGTVMNEGANKGIIVTTSHFGKDAYDFAKNKPLTLIDGSNLLYLLQKHGHQAKIDIEEAKLLKK